VVTSGARTPNRERGGVFLNFSRHRPPVRVGQHTLRLQLWSFPPLPGAPYFPARKALSNFPITLCGRGLAYEDAMPVI
jgi:hypothetical protein